MTLTYRTADLPMLSVPGVGFIPTLRPDDFVLFMKRLRRVRGPGVRFLQTGEYGKLGRPHHHALLFNCGFSDKKVHSVRPRGSLFRSAELEELWPFGFSSIGEVTFESASYVARYTLKKVAGPLAASHYNGRVPEYLTMSRRPGIGAGWFRRFKSDVFPLDRMVARVSEGGRPVVGKPPRFYDELYRREDPEGYEAMRRSRFRATEAESYRVENTDARGAVKEECLNRRVSDFLKRGQF